MTHMEIASYLGILSVGLADVRDKGKPDPLQDKILEAVRSAQMICYELALTKIAENLKESNK